MNEHKVHNQIEVDCAVRGCKVGVGVGGDETTAGGSGEGTVGEPPSKRAFNALSKTGK